MINAKHPHNHPLPHQPRLHFPQFFGVLHSKCTIDMNFYFLNIVLKPKSWKKFMSWTYNQKKFCTPKSRLFIPLPVHVFLIFIIIFLLDAMVHQVSRILCGLKWAAKVIWVLFGSFAMFTFTSRSNKSYTTKLFVAKLANVGH